MIPKLVEMMEKGRFKKGAYTESDDWGVRGGGAKIDNNFFLQSRNKTAANTLLKKSCGKDMRY